MAKSTQQKSEQQQPPRIIHMQVRISKALHDQLRKISFDERRSQNEIMLEALTYYLEDREK